MSESLSTQELVDQLYAQSDAQLHAMFGRLMGLLIEEVPGGSEVTE